MDINQVLQDLMSYLTLFQEILVTTAVAMGIILVLQYFLKGRLNSKTEESRLYYVDSKFINFVEKIGDFYNFTHMAVWATDEVPSQRIRWNFIARGHVIIDGQESIDRRAYFICQFSEGDYIHPEFSDVDNAEDRMQDQETKPFLALFTDDKNTAAQSVAPSLNSEVWAKNSVIYDENETKKFVYKDEALVSDVFKEDEWTKMKPMNLRSLNRCISETSCSDMISNNCQHFVRELWKTLQIEPELEDSKSKSDLLEKIRTSGKDILTKFCNKRDHEPTMLPPIPRSPQTQIKSEFIDKYPDAGLMEKRSADHQLQQETYEAEVKVYRALESLREDITVLHGLEYTSRQCGLFQECDKNIPGNQVVGECDFVVIGKKYVVMIEVSHERADDVMSVFHKMRKKCERTEGLVRKVAASFDKNFNNFPFTKWFCAFPNLTSKSLEFTAEESSRIIYDDPGNSFEQWWSSNVTEKIFTHSDSHERMVDVAQFLIGLWNIDSKNDFNLEEKFSLGKNILRTQKQLNSYTNFDVEMTDDTLKEIGINYLSREQHEIIECEKTFLWISGPAGSGKSILIMGKVMKLLTEMKKKRSLSTKRKRVLLFSNRGHDTYQLVYVYERVLCREGFRVAEIRCNYGKQLEQELFHCKRCKKSDAGRRQHCSHLTSDVVIVEIAPCFMHDKTRWLERMVTKRVSDKFHVFIDGIDSLLRYSRRYNADETVIPDYFTAPDSTSVIWIASSLAKPRLPSQGSPHHLYTESNIEIPSRRNYTYSEKRVFEKAMVNPPASLMKRANKSTSDIETVSDVMVTLSTNMRSTVDISKMLTEIQDEISSQPKQVAGHCLYGPLPVLHIVNSDDKEAMKTIVNTEINNIFDVLDIEYYDHRLFRGYHNQVLALLVNDANDSKMLSDLREERGILPHTNVRHLKYVDSCDWPAVIALMNANEEFLLSDLSHALSRANVYCFLILYNYVENKNTDLDRLLQRLKPCTKNNMKKRIVK